MMNIWTDELNEQHYRYYKYLVKQTKKWDTILSDLVNLDVREAACDNNYFVFEDLIRNILMPLMYDKWVWSYAEGKLQPTIGVAMGTLHQNFWEISIDFQQTERSWACSRQVAFFHLKDSLNFVDHCVISMRSQRVLILHSDKSTFGNCSYLQTTQFCSRYFSLLHTMSSHPQGILHLSKLFEDNLAAKNPKLVNHLVFELNDCSPLKFAFPWLMQAFSGFLEVQQVRVILRSIH